jgi:hypothetical protein
MSPRAICLTPTNRGSALRRLVRTTTESGLTPSLDAGGQYFPRGSAFCVAPYSETYNCADHRR